MTRGYSNPSWVGERERERERERMKSMHSNVKTMAIEEEKRCKALSMSNRMGFTRSSFIGQSLFIFVEQLNRRESVLNQSR
jgi:hypothetical protein